MKCPVDGETLVIAERSGVEIDYCPTCRGVWLDRGELDKIIERADAAVARAGTRAAPARMRGGDGRHDDDDDDDRGSLGRGRPQKERKESILGELFDFF